MSVTQTGTTNRTDYLLDGRNVVQEFHEATDVNNNITLQLLATYCLGGRGIEYRSDSSGARSWYLYDGLGSVLAEIGDMDGSYNVTLAAAPATDVYGNPISTEAGSNHRFCGGLGHKTDSDTGLVYMRARYYDPAIGRFASEDPACNGSNWYAYCNNNPVNAFDANGKFWHLVAGAIIGAVVGGLSNCFYSGKWDMSHFFKGAALGGAAGLIAAAGGGLVVAGVLTAGEAAVYGGSAGMVCGYGIGMLFGDSPDRAFFDGLMCGLGGVAGIVFAEIYAYEVVVGVMCGLAGMGADSYEKRKENQ